MSRIATSKERQSNLREQKILFPSWLITDARYGTIFGVNMLDDIILLNAKPYYKDLQPEAWPYVCSVWHCNL